MVTSRKYLNPAQDHQRHKKNALDLDSVKLLLVLEIVRMTDYQEVITAAIDERTVDVEVHHENLPMTVHRDFGQDHVVVTAVIVIIIINEDSIAVTGIQDPFQGIEDEKTVDMIVMVLRQHRRKDHQGNW